MVRQVVLPGPMVPQAWPHHQEQEDKLLEATLRVLLGQQGALMEEACNQQELQEVWLG